MSDASSLITERSKTHGDFSHTAKVAQAIHAVLATGLGHKDIHPIMAEALNQIAVKLARIVCGDPSFPGHWEDVAGYSQLVLDHLKQKEV